MPTIYVRDVPEDVAQKLKQRAADRGQSVSAYVAAELASLVSKPTNAEIAERLRRVDRSAGPSTQEILAELDAGRR